MTAASSPAAIICPALLAGELAAWPSLATSTGVPEELKTLAKDGAPTDIAALSDALRRISARQATASDSLAVASAAILRLTSLGYDDPAWGDLLPRWLVPSLSPEVRGLGLLALALNARERLCADDYAELMDESLHLLPQDAPLRHAHLLQYALYLALRGMLRRLDGVLELPSPGDQEPEVDPLILAECFYDAVCCGRSAQAAYLERQLAAAPQATWQMGLFQMHRVHIPVLAAIANRTSLPDSSEAPSLPLIRALLGSDPDLLHAFEVDETAGELSPLLGFDGLRIALAKRDTAAARRIIERRALGPERHWLDEFFLARLLLLEDRPREAGIAFAKAEASAQRYGAIERLEIELRLSSELSLHDCCRLGLLAGGPESPLSATKTIASSDPADAILVGTSAAATTLRDRIDRVITAAPAKILILGPNDGSRSLIAENILTRLGGGTCVRLSAAGEAMSGWGDSLASALRANGTVIVEDLEFLSAAGQALLLTGLARGCQARVILTASNELSASMASGTWRRDLFWSLAEHLVRVPDFGVRDADRASMIAALGGPELNLRWEAQAAAALAAVELPGGWCEFRVFAHILLNCAVSGVVGLRCIELATAELKARGGMTASR